MRHETMSESVLKLFQEVNKLCPSKPMGSEAINFSNEANNMMDGRYLKKHLNKVFPDLKFRRVYKRNGGYTYHCGAKPNAEQIGMINAEVNKAYQEWAASTWHQAAKQ